MASQYPFGEFVHISNNNAMARNCFRKFIIMLDTMGAPMNVNNSMLSVRLPQAVYFFKSESQNLRRIIKPTDKVFEDHIVSRQKWDNETLAKWPRW